MSSQKIDRLALLQLKEGNYLAFKAVYDHYAPPLLNFIYKIVKDIDLAQDILQLTFVKVWKSHAQIDMERSFDAYLFQIASYSSIDLLRQVAQNERKKEKLKEQAEEFSLSVEEAFLLKEQHLIIDQILSQLPPQRRAIFRLCKLEGYSYQEAATELGVSVSTVSNQLVSALKTLRQTLNGRAKNIIIISYLYLQYLYF
ncbi:RNA polymerase sigma factor [Sphingobacterium griseoflavum]|uniref:RNA polymerase sigma factor n=1 Tax=Sphingobacterium griseoflavum TaxID=1474952 RepID=A0ABQ3HT05_9SPHI|nr:RNA polymerase sigma-70 factor [Sphingobacterium griseoflavum]GHE31443.1 DNA-directed RNA polymerase sigma-70 factor [Sphingobacterium griseoflavum]